jgi:hypothetical protein
MCRCEVAAENLPAPPAVKADHEVAAVRSVDGDGRFGRGGGLGGLPEFGEGSVNDGEKIGKLACGDAVVGEVAANNLGDEVGFDRLAFRHRIHPRLVVEQVYHTEAE